MKSTAKRLDRIETSLTPRQAVLLWMEQAHQHPSIHDYVQSLKGKPETAFPLYLLPDQMEKAAQSQMKGRPKEEVSRAIRSAVRDVVFLFHLHMQANTRVLSEQRAHALQTLLLITELKSLQQERSLADRMRWASIRMSMGFAYPLDPEAAAAVKAAMAAYVERWEFVDEAVLEWVQEGFSNEGRDDDVSDDEFETRCATVEQAMQGLVSAGEVKEGVVVHLETVPCPFLKDAPLVDGRWIDRYVVELAEWGARMQQKGFVLSDSDDAHPLAWERFVQKTTEEEHPDDTAGLSEKLRAQVRRGLSRFPGETRQLSGRMYLSFDDYCRWRGRRVKGKLNAAVSKGIVLASWNRWVEAQGGEGVAVLGDVRVGMLNCHAEGCPYHVCVDADELAQRLKERALLLDGLRVGEGGCLRERSQEMERVRRWKAMAESLLCELYSMQQAIRVISTRYLDACEVLFPEAARHVEDTIGTVESMVEMFSDGPAWDLEHHEGIGMVEDSGSADGESEQPEQAGYQIDLEALMKEAGERAIGLAAYLVDMAKAEALDFMGDNRAAVALVDRHMFADCAST